MNDDESTSRSALWRWAAGIFLVINIGGIPLAVAMGETSHALVHVGFLFAGYIAWQLTSGSRKHPAVQIADADPRLDYLQHSVDAIALEVERIGEAQRFNEKLRTKPN
ncbi:MAG TPA: hypothetical protein VM099_06900 [Gemmatimonadaceae bacterium]|nr:hypothetical protein [Gemmatimonadaceae bacterium]